MIHLDTSKLPLVSVRCAGRIGAKEMHDYMRAHGQLLGREVEHTLLLDLADAELARPLPDYLVEVSRWVGQRAGDFIRNCRAIAVVVDDDACRHAVDVHFDVRPLDLPMCVFHSVGDADAWLSPFFSRAEESEELDVSVETAVPNLQSSHGSAATTNVDPNEKDRWSPYASSGSYRYEK